MTEDQQLIDNNEKAIQSIAADMLKRYTKDPENYPLTDKIIK